MSSKLTSQGVVLATVMAVSSTVVFLAFSKQKTLPHQVLSESRDSESPTPSQDLRSCLSTGTCMGFLLSPPSIFS